MADKESLVVRLEALDGYLAELDHYAQFSFEEVVSDFVMFRAVQLSLQLAAQVIVDIASHIVTAEIVNDILLNGRADMREFDRQIAAYLKL